MASEQNRNRNTRGTTHDRSTAQHSSNVLRDRKRVDDAVRDGGLQAAAVDRGRPGAGRWRGRRSAATPLRRRRPRLRRFPHRPARVAGQGVGPRAGGVRRARSCAGRRRRLVGQPALRPAHVRHLAQGARARARARPGRGGRGAGLAVRAAARGVDAPSAPTLAADTGASPPPPRRPTPPATPRRTPAAAAPCSAT